MKTFPYRSASGRDACVHNLETHLCNAGVYGSLVAREGNLKKMRAHARVFFSIAASFIPEQTLNCRRQTFPFFCFKRCTESLSECSLCFGPTELSVKTLPAKSNC